MPIPTENAFRRTGRAVEFFESLRRNRDTVAPTLHEGLRELQWVKLGGDVYGTVTASGTIETWSVSANGYNASSFTVTVRDTTKLLFGASGNWVLCRPSVQSGSPARIMDLVWAADNFMASTTGGVYSTSSTFTATTPGGSTITVTNWCGWQADTGGRECMVCPDGQGGFRFVQGGCWPAP